MRSRILRRLISRTVSPGPRPDAAGKAGESCVLARQPRQCVPQLGEFDLKLAIATARTLGEHVENELCSVDRLQPGLVFEGSRLGRLEVDVEDRHFGAQAHPFEDDLLELASADNSPRMQCSATLAHGARDLDVRGAHQFEGLREGLVIERHPHHQHSLPVGPAGCAAQLTAQFTLEGSNRAVEVEDQIVDAARLQSGEKTGGAWRRGLAGMFPGHGSRIEMGHLDASCRAVLDLDNGHEVEAQKGEIVEVVAAQRFTVQVSVDEPKSPKSP